MKSGYADRRPGPRGITRSWLCLLCLGLTSCQALNQPPDVREAGIPLGASVPDVPAEPLASAAAGAGDLPAQPASWSVTVEESPKAAGAIRDGSGASIAGSPRRAGPRLHPRLRRLDGHVGRCRVGGPCPPGDAGVIACPLPAGCTPYQDEYLCDGGDRERAVEVMPDWTVYGLEFEDTVAHYDTLDGRTEVEASNRVCLYAPRFASVRQVTGLVINRQRTLVAGFEQPLQLNAQEALGGPTVIHQPLQPERYIAAKGVQQFREQLRGNDLANAQAAAGLINRFKAYEDLQLIRNGQFDNAEKARLAEGTTAALVWTADQGVQLCIGDVTLVEVTGDKAPQSVYRYDLPPGKPRMRVVKVASKRAAQPGDEVEFTIRFDNVGDEVVGNVTLIDNLTPRLAYVPDTAECSLTANFSTQENDGGSLILRWEILDPIEVGEGGIIRFTCRVR